MILNIQPKTEIAYPRTLEELEALRKFHKKEMNPIVLAIHSINPGVLHNSPSRSVMMTQHLPQHLVIEGSEPPYVHAGLEYQLGKYTFATRMPANGTIKRVVNRYQREVGTNSINGTPEVTVIYAKDSNGEYDVFNISEYKSYHQYFGFKNKFTPKITELKPNACFAEGTKFADTPANTEDEFYTYGINLNTCCMDVPGVAEDGVIVSRSILKKLRVKVYEVREISFGRNSFPLNLFGDSKSYKIFKDIGERIRIDGLLMAVRNNQDLISPVAMAEKELRTVDHTFDKKLYSRVTDVSEDLQHMTDLGGKVIDIKVIRNNDAGRHLPPTMTEQLEKYVVAYQKYCKELIAFEQKVIYEAKQRNTTAIFSPELTGLLSDARAISGFTNSRLQGSLGLQYRRTPLDEYTVTFVIEHELEPNLGWKLTALNGDKGVIVQIWEDDWMPVDEDGNRADIICSSNSTVARSNWGRSFIPYFAAAARDLRKRLLKLEGVPKVITEESISLMDENAFNDIYNKLLFFYSILSPKMFYWYNQVVVSKEERVKHVTKCLSKFIYLFMPVDNPINDIDAVIHLEKHFPQTYGKLRYRGVGGYFVTTEDKVRIAPMYFMVLEKIADDGSSANIGKRQHHGLLASQTKEEKYAQNYRPNHTRNFGEAEMRLTMFYARSIKAAAEIHDRSNNPLTMHYIAKEFLTNKKPTNIRRLVPRDVIEYGGVPIQFLQHFMRTCGASIEHINERDAMEIGYKESFNEC